MPRALRLALITIAVPLVLLTWAGLVFAMDRAGDQGEILGRVVVGEAELAGLTRAEALAVVREVESNMANAPLSVTVANAGFVLYPREIGFVLDEEALVDEAMLLGRDGGFLGEMTWWLTNLTGGSTRVLEAHGSFDRDALAALLQGWEATAITDTPLEGGITLQGGGLAPIYPRAGTGLDYAATMDLISAALLGDGGAVVAVTRSLTPDLTDTDVDAALVRAESLTASSVTLVSPDHPDSRVVIPQDVLRRSLSSQVITKDNGDFALDLFFDLAPLAQLIDSQRSGLETPPRDARVAIGLDDLPAVVPGAYERKIDDGRLPSAVLSAARSVTRTATLPMRDGAAPDLTTEEAEALGIRSLLYTAVTYYTAGGDTINQNRVHNIHLIADEVDGAIVLPGAVFSLNEHVGERTREGGYLPAKAVVYRGPLVGRIVYCCDHPANIGGGVSQFATTLYNAIWWAGLEDIEHTPHSIHFTRYPMVREATLGYPDPDIKFRNNTEHGILIDTEYTETSITVRVFGDNGGITVEGVTSPRRWFEQPYSYYESDRSLPPGVEEVRTEGTAGFTADVTRIIRHPDGTETTEMWTWSYDPNPTVIAIHPCSLPEDHPNREEVCPVQVPELSGMTPGQAQAALGAVGLVYQEGVPITVTDPELAGKVGTQSPASGTWLDIGLPVTVRIGVIG